MLYIRHTLSDVQPSISLRPLQQSLSDVWKGSIASNDNNAVESRQVFGQQMATSFAVALRNYNFRRDAGKGENRVDFFFVDWQTYGSGMNELNDAADLYVT